MNIQNFNQIFQTQILSFLSTPIVIEDKIVIPMETKPELIPQYIYNWAIKHKETLKSLYKDFCIETKNPDKTKIPEFCQSMYFECKH